MALNLDNNVKTMPIIVFYNKMRQTYKTNIQLSILRPVGAGVVSLGGPVVAATGGDISLPCRALGDPAPSRVWTYEGGPLSGDR